MRNKSLVFGVGLALGLLVTTGPAAADIAPPGLCHPEDLGQVCDSAIDKNGNELSEPGVCVAEKCTRQLRRELGSWGLLAAAALTLAVPVLACCGSVVGAKDLYLSLSAFHAYLELAAGAVFFVSLSGPRASAATTCC